MTPEERDKLGRGVPFSKSGRLLLVHAFRADVALAELFATASLSTFLASPWQPATGKFDYPVPCMAIGCYTLEQVSLFDANIGKIESVLHDLGYRFDWITAGICI